MASIAKFDIWQNTLGFTYNSIVQVVSATNSTPVTLNTTTPTDVISLIITTKLPGSNLLILFSDDHNGDSNGSWKYVSPYVDGVEYGKHISSITTAGFQDIVNITRLVGPVTQGSHTVAIKAYNGSAQSTFHEAGNANLVVLEVVQ
jgi:hypothetical protein